MTDFWMPVDATMSLLALQIQTHYVRKHGPYASLPFSQYWASSCCDMYQSSGLECASQSDLMGSQADLMGIMAIAAVCALQLPSAVTLCIAHCG